MCVRWFKIDLTREGHLADDQLVARLEAAQATSGGADGSAQLGEPEDGGADKVGGKESDQNDVEEPSKSNSSSKRTTQPDESERPAPIAAEGAAAGHTMVEGSSELAAEVRQSEVDAVKDQSADAAATEPAALDDEVAQIVAEEEAKEGVPASPDPIRAISPLPPSGRASPAARTTTTTTAGRDEDEGLNPPEVETQPAALDEEVARVVVEEERKENLDTGGTGTGRISPLPPSREKSPHGQVQVETPPLPTSALPDDDVMDLDNGADEGETDGAGPSKKREREKEEETVPAPKRPRAKEREAVPLPDSLSHLLHPPTSTLYLANLRRPLLHPALHSYIYEEASPISDPRLPEPRNPFASTEYPGLWLSGIKSHAYATFSSIQEAVNTAQRIEGQIWPEDTGGKLHVEFVDDDIVRDLVDKEEAAWANGRQKLNLKISKGQDGEVKFEFEGAGSIGPGPSRGDRSRNGNGPLPLAGPGPSSVGIRGQAGFGGRQPAAGGMPLTGSNSIAPAPRTGINGHAPRSAPTGPASRDGRDASGPGTIPASRGLPPHMHSDRIRAYGLGDGGRAGTEADRSQRREGRDRYRDGDRGRYPDDRRDTRDVREPPRRAGGGDSWRPGDAMGERKGVLEKRTKTRPGLLWAEGPDGRSR